MYIFDLSNVSLFDVLCLLSVFGIYYLIKWINKVGDNDSGSRTKHHSINPEDHKDGDCYVYKIPFEYGGGRLKVRRYSENNVSTYFVRKYNNKYYISIENKSLGKMDSIEDDFLWHLNRRASKIFKYWASLEGKDVNFGFWDCLYVIGH